MGSITVAPDDDALLVTGHYSMQRDRERISFSRCYDQSWHCGRGGKNGDEPLMAPGARVSLLTDATKVYAVLEYGGVAGYCSADCVGTPPSQCYRPGGGATCRNRCEARLYVDGVARPLLDFSVKSVYRGEEVLVLLNEEHAAMRRVELVMPWGGVVAFRGMTLSPASARRARPPAPALSAVFYGDSITQGFCADVPFPDAIGMWNGWESINLGIGGMVRAPAVPLAPARLAAPGS